MRDKNSLWMMISGATGLSFFFIANFTDLFTGLSVFVGCLQICINIFIFVIWRKVFLESSGLKRLIAFFGVIVPIIMASITIWRVFIPAIVS